MRLLQSVNEANYPDDDIQVIISIDGDADPMVIDAANQFQFKSGSVEVIIQKENLGIHRHILECGDLSRKFGSILILEDDLVIGPAFYEYAQKTLSFYDSEETISGVALYAQRFNETAQLPFEPVDSEWPVYLMQLGCSWGQAWTQKQWEDFRMWLSENRPEASFIKSEIPRNIQEWPDTSWKKYYNQYLIDQDKYIVYPYSSFSTNSSEGGGTHMKYVSNTFQVPLNMSQSLNTGFKLPSIDEDTVRYDCFMETRSRSIENWANISFDETEMDLYGTKPLELLKKKKFVITSKPGRNPIRTFPLSFRPVELNLKYELSPESDDGFFHLFKTDDLILKNETGTSQYFILADYYSYFPIRSRRFVKIFSKEMFQLFPEWIQRFFNK